MISHTRDKAVIHRHGVGYEKIAVGKSLPGVARELEVYQLLNQKSPQQFAYSQVEEAEKGTRDVHFLMNYAVGLFPKTIPILVLWFILWRNFSAGSDIGTALGRSVETTGK